jgi:site-specific DNA-methyltransferase (adenine-specific)
MSEILTKEEFALLEKALDFQSGRMNIIKRISIPHESNWQCVETPLDVCREMLDLTADADFYIVFFALEFLEILVKERKFDSKKILFIADNQLESDVAFHEKMYQVDGIILDKTQEITGKNLVDKIKGANMKFNKLAVVGNPPYQMQSDAQKERDGGKSQAKSIYHLFVEAIIDGLNPDLLSLIIPSRWMTGGMGLDKHRERMMNDKRIKKIVHFPNPKEVFETVSIAGGVNYFLWNKNYNDKCAFCVGNTKTFRFLSEYDIVVQDNNAIDILDKVRKVSNKWISQKCLSNKPFGLSTNFSDWKKLGVKCVNIGKKEFFVEEKSFTDKNNIFNKWKVCTSKATSEGNITDDNLGLKKIVSNFFIIEPNVICTETYIVVNVFDKKEEAENFLSYMRTKFFRFMLGLRVVTQDINKEKFSWVPDVEDYTAKWTDEELYKKYNLTRQEINYIESKIKNI